MVCPVCASPIGMMGCSCGALRVVDSRSSGGPAGIMFGNLCIEEETGKPFLASTVPPPFITSFFYTWSWRVVSPDDLESVFRSEVDRLTVERVMGL